MMMKRTLIAALVGLVMLPGSCSTAGETKKGRVAIKGICDKCSDREVREMKKVFETRLQRLGFTSHSISTNGNTLYMEVFGDHPDWHVLRDTLPQGMPGHRFIITDEEIDGPALGK